MRALQKRPQLLGASRRCSQSEQAIDPVSEALARADALTDTACHLSHELLVPVLAIAGATRRSFTSEDFVTWRRALARMRGRLRKELFSLPEPDALPPTATLGERCRVARAYAATAGLVHRYFLANHSAFTRNANGAHDSHSRMFVDLLNRLRESVQVAPTLEQGRERGQVGRLHGPPCSETVP